MPDDLSDPGTGGTPQGDAGSGPGTGEGSSASTWFDGLPEDMKGNEAYAGFKERKIEDLLTEHVKQGETLKRAIVVPGENASDEEKATFEAALKKALGVPEKVTDYKLQLPEGVPADDPVLTRFMTAAHANGLNSIQAQNVLSDVVQGIAEHREAQKLVNQEAVKKLWGDQYQSNVNLAVKGMEGLGADCGISKEEIDSLSKQLPSFPVWVRMLAHVGKLYSEDAVNSGRGTSGNNRTAAEIVYPDQGK